ncbi:hypothetical protein KCTC52924_03591 [Arenibacter antarcticus]|uniref:Uncharacterized protein n=1 Tax=Arenibacter antarcticus TaxID=2040469 RepID=A0ABW5VG03_9FLAO|nr:hypothetical protein [Arenibacter sp. H213]MCM4169813.1 hypothetical protein [Arenibacter sp. H213]
MDLEKVFINLRNNLYQPLLFFIPKSLVPEEKKDLLKDPSFSKYFNIPAIIKRSGESFELKNSSYQMEFLGKPAILDKNILILTEQKATTHLFQFNVLMEKYRVQLDFYTTITRWMAQHFTEHCGAEDDVNYYFELQDQFFQNHLQEIETKFGKIKIAPLKPADVLEHIENELVPFKKEEPGKSIPDLDSKVSKPKKKKTKRPVITDEEASKYILKTVFNIED